MNNTIEQIKPNVFFTKARGSSMTLTKINNCLGNWQMETTNASQRAHRGLGIKYFDTLAQVEKQYKSWQGIIQLTSSNDANSINKQNSILH